MERQIAYGHKLINITRCKCITIDSAKFIATDLDKYTSYEDKRKSCVELKESSNFDADIKQNINKF